MGKGDSKLKRGSLIVWFNEMISSDEKKLLKKIGGKSMGLGLLYSLSEKNTLSVPNGFCISTAAYRSIVDSRVRGLLDELLSNVEISDNSIHLNKMAENCRRVVYEASDKQWLKDIISKSYSKLCDEYENYDDTLSVAVRSSATAEDLPNSSFAGQHDSFLNVQGLNAIYEATRHCLASVFTARAISYRHGIKYPHLDVELSVIIMKMVRSDKASAGVAFTCDTESGNENVLLVTANHGLGESVVQGSVNVDSWFVHAPTYRLGYRSVLHHRLGSKEEKMIFKENASTSKFYSDSTEKSSGAAQVYMVPTTPSERDTFCLTDEEVLSLVGDILLIQDESKIKQLDIEFAKDGVDNKLYIVQCRPETIQSQKNELPYIEICEINAPLDGKQEKLIVSGTAIGSSVGQGPFTIIENTSTKSSSVAEFECKTGDILICDMTSPDMVPLMKKCAGIITERGGQTCHAAIVARELGLPCIVGASSAISKFRSYENDVSNGDKTVTLSSCEGSIGFCYKGSIPYETFQISKDDIPKPQIRVCYNIANPNTALYKSLIHNEGCGLVRMEWIISNIGVHPMAAFNPEKLPLDERTLILSKSKNFSSPREWYVQTLCEELALLTAAFYPEIVNIRMSDFKSNEFHELIGGSTFEEKESNPMLGFRGAFRYTDASYTDGFSLECAAICMLRDYVGLSNIEVMIPFVRTYDDARDVLQLMSTKGLVGETYGSLHGFTVPSHTPASDGTATSGSQIKINMMVEVPSNVICIEHFALLFDGFSIGTNDLSSLTLGIDRDSEKLQRLLLKKDNDPAVLKLISFAITHAHKMNKKIGICGEMAASDFKFLEFLMKNHIDYLSVNPSSVFDVMKTALQIETQMQVQIQEEECKDEENDFEPGVKLDMDKELVKDNDPGLGSLLLSNTEINLERA